MSNIKYRKDIDGLRALAVLSVVMFHLDVSWVKSGFLGVDIFFVISGYLITTIIIRDLKENTFSLKSFYLRRVRRIFPALITVLLISTIFAWIILLPQDLENYSKSLVSALVSVSNLYFFNFLNFGYFSTNATIIPLLHTWSLGVEEQFYIFWPLILISIFNVGIRFKWKDKNIGPSKFSLFSKLVAISVIIFVYSIFCFKYFSYFEITNHYSEQNYYYYPLTRAFELLFGCILAIYFTKSKPLNSKILLNILSALAIVFMLYPILFRAVPYPSNWSIITCLGATLYIYSGSDLNYTPIINRIFCIKPIVAIGLISYSLYLWHWPIIAYINYLSIDKTYLVKTIIFIISLCLATLTYFFVEKPFRYRIKLPFIKTIILLCLIPIFIASCFALGSVYVKNFGFNKPIINQNKLDFKYGFESVDKNGCFYNFESPNNENVYKKYNPQNCKVFKNKESHILVIGNSHARSDWPMISQWVKNVDSNATLLAITPNLSNPALPRILYPSNLVEKVKNPIMRVRFNFMKNAIKRNSQYNVIIFAMMKNLGLKGANDPQKIYYKILKQALQNGKKVVLIVDTPYLGQPAKTFVANGNITNLCAINRVHLNCKISSVIYHQYIKPYMVLYYQLKHSYPNQVFIVSPSRVICNKATCKTTVNKIPIFADAHHLNSIGSKLLGKKYLEELGNPLIPVFEGRLSKAIHKLIKHEDR
ncbi:acyltransferase family protein [Francisella sp. 19X1-34]|uniref:acyltransferase family protein n=1 Tax=Francisella sp. 19X1-34 TaxID=3087177 RepID=UPI002E329832|nr:acyltransferase family protein [Francisella sp. 19X1-34]MED7787525.1 acyltransferase family protein [Francisella sp. 19X1-34]